VFGELYDLATGSFFQLAASILGIFFLIDWLSNFSPNPRTMSVGDRLFRRAGDAAHLLFSWPIAWAHFLFASILCAVFLPPDEVVVGGLTDLWSQFAGVASLIGFTLVFSIVIAIAGGYLLLKHAGAFVYTLVGIAAYPLLVAASIPDHPVIGRLGEYATSAREGYVVAAWYPVPTAAVLGIGYTIDQAVLSALTLGGPIGEVGGGGLYYPVLWLAALYAPEKVFKNGSVPRRLRDGLLAAGAGGAAGAATGSAAGASAGTSTGLVAGSGAGAAGALPAGAATGAGAGATSASAGSVAATASRMRAGSPGASALADGGTVPTTGSGDSGTGRLGGASAGSSLGGGSGATGSGRAGATGSDPDGLTQVGSRDDLDTSQRYEPVVQHDSGEFARVSSPKDANWLTDQGGGDRLNRGTDDLLYFRGESDGELYDLGGATDSGIHGRSGTETASGTKDSVRNL
jgi:hypothetical protein